VKSFVSIRLTFAAVAGLAAPRMWLAEGYSISPMGLPPFPASNSNALTAFSLFLIAVDGFLPRLGRWGGFDILSFFFFSVAALELACVALRLAL
jgi:hypothetical protein